MESTPTSGLTSARTVATGLLVASAVLFALARWQEPFHPAWGYLRAFAEASMVGGLADWFAVTALFRRPLGLPLPHTAVIPNSQGRIADALGQFIVENFLDPDLLAERMRGQDLSEVVGEWLAHESNADRLAAAFAHALPALLDTLDDATVAAFLERQAQTHGRVVRAAPAASAMVLHITNQGRHEPLIDAFIQGARRSLSENAEPVHEILKTRVPWVARAAFGGRVVAQIDSLLLDAERDRNHPLRRAVTAALRKFAAILETSPQMQMQVEGIKDAVLAHSSAKVYLGDLWKVAKTTLRSSIEDPDSSVERGISEAAHQLGKGLLADPEAREALNTRIQALVVDLARLHGPDVGEVVSDTVRSWDSAVLIEKLEQNVGSDLQYIRINGTLIGGLVGVLIHLVGSLLAP